MSVMLLKDTYKAFISSNRTSLEQLCREFTRIDNILAEFNSTVGNTLLDELEDELDDIRTMLDTAIEEYRKDQLQAEENYKYELRFKPNR